EVLWVVLVVVIIVFIFADKLTAAGLGEDIATNIGLNYNQILLLGTALVSIATVVVTVVVGALPFLGLIVPYIVSMCNGDDLRYYVPWLLLLGIVGVTVSELLGRSISPSHDLPVSLGLGIVGARVIVRLDVRSARDK